METPKIITERLCIEPFSEEHLSSRYVGWLNDKNTMRFSEQRHVAHDLESCKAYMRSFKGTPNHFWALLHRGKGHVGNMNAYVDFRNHVADVGILIGETWARGCGLGKEAWLGVAKWLLFKAGMRKVTAGCMASNTAMVHLMERSGMRQDGVRRRHLILDGKAVDVVHYAFFLDEIDPAKSEMWG